METRYDEVKGVVVIGKPIEVPLTREEYDAVQAVTNNRFGEFYREYNLGRIGVEGGHVIHLNISRLELKLLDPCIGDLGSLKKCHANNNQFTSLPDSIGNLVSLEVFDVRGNQLPRLPDSIGNLCSLKEVYVFGNPLDEKSKKLLEKLKKRGVEVYF